MDCRYIDPNFNTTLTLPADVYIIQAAVLSVVFPLSFVGTVMNVVFICRKNTNFLVRRIVYMTVTTTLQLGVFWVWSFPAFKPDESMYNFCMAAHLLYDSVAIGLTWIMALLVCSIYFTLVRQLCDCFSRRHPAVHDRSCLKNSCLETLFVVITLFVGLIFGVLTYVEDMLSQVLLTIGFYLIPALLLISFIGNIALIIWFCTLRRRQIARRRDILKEIGIFFVLFFIVLLVLGIDFTAPFSFAWLIAAQTFIATFISCFPLLVFVYMCYSFRSRTRHVRFANRADIETAGPGLRTAPPSTRVSLPTDTADHAPNFLSPSTAEPSEVTLLIN